MRIPKNGIYPKRSKKIQNAGFKRSEGSLCEVYGYWYLGLGDDAFEEAENRSMQLRNALLCFQLCTPKVAKSARRSFVPAAICV